jgi:putative oxidoreductase
MSATTLPLTRSAEANLASYGALALRVAMGLLFIAHGAIKLFVFTPAGTVGYFASLGLPAPLAYLTIAAEIIGGAMLVLGLYSRLVAIALIPVMLGALFLGHAGNGFLFSAKGGGWEYPAFWTITLIVQALIGDGTAALRPWSPRGR